MSSENQWNEKKFPLSGYGKPFSACKTADMNQVKLLMKYFIAKHGWRLIDFIVFSLKTSRTSQTFYPLTILMLKDASKCSWDLMQGNSNLVSTFKVHPQI